MLKWAAIFFLISIVAGVLGFGGVAGASAGIAKFLFIAFLIFAVAFVFLGYKAVDKVT